MKNKIKQIQIIIQFSSIIYLISNFWVHWALITNRRLKHVIYQCRIYVSIVKCLFYFKGFGILNVVHMTCTTEAVTWMMVAVTWMKVAIVQVTATVIYVTYAFAMVTDSPSSPSFTSFHRLVVRFVLYVLGFWNGSNAILGTFFYQNYHTIEM